MKKFIAVIIVVCMNLSLIPKIKYKKYIKILVRWIIFPIQKDLIQKNMVNFKPLD